jgi:hypothetical protein
VRWEASGSRGEGEAIGGQADEAEQLGVEANGGRRGEQNDTELETMDYLEFTARVTSHIPDKVQVMVRYSGL